MPNARISTLEMLMIPGSFEFEGLLCFRRASASRAYYYLPLLADLDRGAHDQPMFTLIATGATGYLMLTAVWRADDRTLEALRNEIASRDEISDPSEIELAFAPVQVTRCDLLMGDSSGELQAIASSSTSGFLPYSALFNVNLTEEQLASAAAAVSGRAGYLVIEYEASLSTPVTATARLVSKSSRLVPWLRDYLALGQAGLRSAIEEAIEEGLATVQLELTEAPSGSVVTALYDRLLTRAAELLPDLIEGQPEGTYTELEIEATLVHEVRRSMQPRRDLSELDLSPTEISVAGNLAPASERAVAQAMESSRPLRVRMGFSPGDAPLAWIRLKRGDSEAVLQAPQFSPVELPAYHASRPVTVTAGYTNGVPPHRMKLSLPGEGEFILEPEHVGLTQVSVDARPLQEAGAPSAQVWLVYRAPGRREVHQQSMHFGDRTWASTWWLSAPAHAVRRGLEYKWTALAADGKLVTQSFEKAGSPDITLCFQGGTADVAD